MASAHHRPVPALRRASSCSLVLATAVLAACPEGPPVHSALGLHGPEAGGAPAARERPATTPENAALAEQMHERFAWVSAIQEVTIQGDVAEARSLAQEFAARLPAPEEPAPEAWRPHVDALRGELEGLRHADDLRDAGASVARLALLCGRCHEATDARLDLPELPEPAQGGSFKDAMHGHQWSVDRMWEGIIGPSDERWIRGSTMFVAIPGCKATTEAGDVEGQALCRHAQSLARRGMVTESREGRATIYGRLLATCAGCHAGARPASPGALDR
jgi:cytochrome c553